MALALRKSEEQLPHPYLSMGEVAYRLSLDPGQVSRLCTNKWQPLGLCRKFGARWGILPDVDSRLGGTRFERRDFEQISELLKSGVKPRHVKRAEAMRDIAIGLADVEPSGRGAVHDVNLYCARVLADDLAGSAGIRKLSKSTLYGWIARYYDGGIAALVRKSTAPGVIEPIGEMAYAKFLTLKAGARKISKAYDVVRNLADTEHAGDPAWAWPSYRTVALRYQHEPRIAKVWMDKGPEAARAYEPKVARSWQNVPAGAILCGDEMTFDFMARVPRDRSWKRARLKLTAWMDVRSRMICGWHISEHANSDTILSAFRMAVKATGTLPNEVLIDNGRDYRSVAGQARRDRKWDEFEPGRIQTAFESLSIEAHYAIKRSPWAKPIEPRFNTLHLDFDAWFPSYWGHKSEGRPWDAQRWTSERIDLLPTEDEVRQSFEAFLLDWHELEVKGDSMFGLSPRQAMQQHYTTSPRICPDNVLEIACCRMFGPVKVGRNGIRHNSSFYGKWDEEVMRLGDQDVYYVADPVDATKIIVCNKDRQSICVANIDHNLGQTQSEVRAAFAKKRTSRRIVKAYPEARHATVATTPQLIARARADARAAQQTPDSALPAASQPESFRMTRSDVAAANDSMQQRAKKAAGAEALRKLHASNKAAELTNDRVIDISHLREVHPAIMDDTPPTKPLSLRSLSAENEDRDDFEPASPRRPLRLRDLSSEEFGNV